MKYTDKQLYFEPRLIQKIDLMIKRRNTHNADNLLLIDGKEGLGKTNLAAGLGYYWAWKTGEKYELVNVFFDPDSMMKYVTSNSSKVVHWDEAAIAALASEWQNKVQRKLIKLLMMARKKKHFYIFCIPKFYKLNEYIVDRAIGLVHVYAKRGIEYGRFTYYNEKKKNALYETWRRKRIAYYKRSYSFHGRFTKYLAKVLDEVGYDKEKDKAIASITTDSTKITLNFKKLIRLQHAIYNMKGMNQEEKSKIFNTSTHSISKWGQIGTKYPELLEK